jgi:uncharacterized phiE125 gp8 family phage protein
MLRVVTPYTGDPLIPLEELKAHLREEQEDTSNDESIAALAEVALEMIEADVQRIYAPRTLAWVRSDFADVMRLPFAGVDKVEAVAYTDLQGEVQTLDPAGYVVGISGRTKEVRRRWGYAWPCVGQGGEPVAITIKAGGEPMPKKVRHVGHLYDNREAVVANASNMGELPLGVEALISSERWS